MYLAIPATDASAASGDAVTPHSIFASFGEIFVRRVDRLLVDFEFFQCAFYGGGYCRHVDGAAGFSDRICDGGSSRVDGAAHFCVEEPDRRLGYCSKQQCGSLKLVARFSSISWWT